MAEQTCHAGSAKAAIKIITNTKCKEGLAVDL
jgi:hypothetical protein